MILPPSITAGKSSFKHEGTNSDTSKWAFITLDEGREMSHSIHQRKWKKKEHILKKTWSNIAFCKISKNRVSLICSITSRRRNPFKEEQAKHPGQKRTAGSWAYLFGLLQSFLTPESCKANYLAIIQVTFMLYWTKAWVFRKHKLYWRCISYELELAISCTNCTKKAAKRGITDEHSYFFIFQQITHARLSELNLLKNISVENSFMVFNEETLAASLLSI